MFVHKARDRYTKTKRKSFARSIAQARDSAAVVVPPDRRADVSVNLPPILYFTEMSFPTAGGVGANVGDFRPADGSEGHGGSSFDA